MPGSAHPLHEPEALHALAHPLRVRILAELREPASAAEVARRLRQSRQNLNYHLKELERGGLVRRVGERRRGAFVETLFRAETRSFLVTSVGSWPVADCEASAAGGAVSPLPAAGRRRGAVLSLHIAPAAAAPVETVDEVVAVPGRGLEGDRYFERAGTFSETPGAGRHVTLIESEAIAALREEAGIELRPADARRNVVTCGVPLNHLVGRELRIGAAVLRGMRLCEPCSHLALLTEPGVLPALVHRGGLRADIVRGGRIRTGDPVVPL